MEGAGPSETGGFARVERARWRLSGFEQKPDVLASLRATGVFESLVSICSSRPLLAKWKGRDSNHAEPCEGNYQAVFWHSGRQRSTTEPPFRTDIR